MKKYFKKGQVLVVALIFIVLFLFYFSQNFKFTLKNENNLSAKSVEIPENFIQNSQINQANFSEFENAIFEDFNQSLLLDLNASTMSSSVDFDQNLSVLAEQNLSKNEIKNQNLKKENKISQQKTDKKEKPKLVIIIDDIVHLEQIRNLKKTGLKLNPSLMPQDKSRPDTVKIARNLDFYMIHLPLAAIHYANQEKDTLYPQDDVKKIESKIKQIKKDFNRVKFINNHTGSLFTSDEKAMRKLLEVFEKYDLIFVDSKTIGKTVTSKLLKDFSQPLIQRDVFLDNQDEVEYIKSQLKIAVKIAHKKGFAIAIGHPRKNTFQALKESKALLKSVELVYLSEIYGK